MLKKLLASTKTVASQQPIIVLQANEGEVERHVLDRFGPAFLVVRIDGNRREVIAAFTRIVRVTGCRRVDTGGYRFVVIHGIQNCTESSQIKLVSLMDRSVLTSRFIITNRGGKALISYAPLTSRCIIVRGGARVSTSTDPVFQDKTALAAYDRLRTAGQNGVGVDKATRTAVKRWIKCASTASHTVDGITHVLRCVCRRALRQGDLWVADVAARYATVCARLPSTSARALLAFAIEVAAQHQIEHTKK